MDNLLVKFDGLSTIRGIIAVRTVFGLGLKQAINLLKSDEGFVVTPLQWIALRGEYMLQRPIEGVSLSVKNWFVETYKSKEPTWLVDHTCREGKLELNTK